MREAVGLFENMEQLQKAVKDLEATEFPRDSLSVLGEKSEMISKFGTPSVAPDKVEDNPNTPREAPVRSEEKTIGAGVLVSGSAYVGAMALALAAGAVTVPGIIAAAAIGGAGGGAIGAVLAKILGHHFDVSIEDQIKKGGLLLWVRTPDVEKENHACNILIKNGANHVKIHDI